MEHLGRAPVVVRIGRDRLDRVAADLALELVGRALGHDVAVVDDPDAVGEDVCLLEVLRREEDGHAVLGGQALDLVPQRGAALRIQAGRRLVEEEDRRAVHERHRQVEAAFHSAGVAADLAIGGVGEPDALQQGGSALGALRLAQPVEPGLELHVLAAGEEVVERRLLQRGADVAAHVGALVGDVEAGDRRAAGRGRQQRREHVHGGRLARAVGPEEAVDLAGRDGQIDAVDRADVAFEDAHQTLDHDPAMVGAHALRFPSFLEVVNHLH